MALFVCIDPASLEGPRLLEFIQHRAPTIASLNAALESYKREREQRLHAAQQRLAAVRDRVRLAATRPITTFVEELVESDVQPLRRSIEQRAVAFIAEQTTKRVPACSNRYVQPTVIYTLLLGCVCLTLGVCSSCAAHQAELAAEAAQAIAEAQCASIKVSMQIILALLVTRSRPCPSLSWTLPIYSWRRCTQAQGYVWLEKR